MRLTRRASGLYTPEMDRRGFFGLGRPMGQSVPSFRGSALVYTMQTATQIAVTTQPAGAASGVALTTQPVVELRDVLGALVTTSTASVTVSVGSGTATLSGTTTVAAVAGVVTFTNLALTGSGGNVLHFTSSGLTAADASSVTISGGFSTPDILNEVSFETNFSPFTSWDFESTPTGVTRDTTQGAPSGGSASVKRTWTSGAGETGSQFAYQPASSYDRLWFRFYFKLTQPITSVMKMFRFYNTNGSENYGGVWIASGSSTISMCWDQENQSLVSGIGIAQASIVDGNWHSLEVDYWRNGDPSGWPSMAFWFDGSQVTHADGALDGQGGQHATWASNRIQAGERASSGKLNWFEVMATLNAGNTTTGQMNIDRICVSSLGRIGP